MEHGQSGEQNDRRDPEVNVGEDHGPYAGGFLRRVFVMHAFSPSTSGSALRLNLLALPAAALEEDHADGGDESFGDHDGHEDATRAHPAWNGEEIRQRNFEQPKAHEIDERW